MRYASLFFFVLLLYPQTVFAHMGETNDAIARVFPAAGVSNEVSIQKMKNGYLLKGNGIPNHKTGHFPGRGNPHAISAQDYSFYIHSKPVRNKSITPVSNRMIFGVALNSVPFDPGTAEYWKRDRHSGWVEEGIVSGQRLLGIDQNNAHVQPNGAYHYHGTPTALVVDDWTHIGYAADGFKIYASRKDAYKPSYRLKMGHRPGMGRSPDGKYDGTYTQDFEYVAGSGDLDQCNGMKKDGEYVYVLTSGFPYVPRCWVGTPDESFKKEMRAGGGRDVRRGLPGGRRPPPRGHRSPPMGF